MSYKLFIFEGSGKKETFYKLVNSGKIPKAKMNSTQGHIYKIAWKVDWKKESIGISLDTFFPNYKLDDKKRDKIRELRREMEESDEVIIFTDSDFEGEVIAYSLYTEFKDLVHKFKRGTTPEISEKWINNALDHLRPLYDKNIMQAGVIRAVLDRIIGWTYSSIVYKKSNGMDNVSAWRCQSPTLRFLTERERDIRNFVPRDYYTIHATHPSFVSSHIKNKTVDINDNLVFNEEDGKNMEVKLKDIKEWIIQDYSETSYETKTKEPFNGTSFQSACSSILGLWMKEITEIWQKLYEGGYVTYIRTDAIVLEDEKNNDIINYINSNLWGKYVPKTPIKYTNPPSAQAWHMWICPVDVSLTPDDAKNELDTKSAQVYEIIWKRAVASQMWPAVYAKQNIKLSIWWETFIYSSATRTFDWFLAIWNYKVKDSDDDVDDSSWIDNITIGDKIVVKNIKLVPHKTKPKARYTEASCIDKMEALRVGRPSTYESLVNVLKERWYIDVKWKKVFVTEKGEAVSDIIMWFAENDIMDFNFTKRMEDLRDKLAKWEIEYLDLAKEFFENIKKTLDANGVYIDADWFVRSTSWWSSSQAEDTWHLCPKCWNGKIMRKTTSKGEILSCSNSTYKDWKAWGCDYFNFLGTYEKTDEVCPLCKGELIITQLKNWTKMKKCQYGIYDAATKKTLWCWFKPIFLK